MLVDLGLEQDVPRCPKSPSNMPKYGQDVAKSGQISLNFRPKFVPSEMDIFCFVVRGLPDAFEI